MNRGNEGWACHNEWGIAQNWGTNCPQWDHQFGTWLYSSIPCLSFFGVPEFLATAVHHRFAKSCSGRAQRCLQLSLIQRRMTWPRRWFGRSSNKGGIREFREKCSIAIVTIVLFLLSVWFDGTFFLCNSSFSPISDVFLFRVISPCCLISSWIAGSFVAGVGWILLGMLGGPSTKSKSLPQR